MLPARDGDCLLLEWGETTPVRRILIDGGRSETYADVRPTIEALRKDGAALDALVVTHIDQDHILGIIEFLKDPQRPIELGDVWFNGYDQLVNSEFERFGAIDGELLTTLLLTQRLPWNRAFGGKAIEVGRPFEPLDRKASFTFLSPDRSQLEGLIGSWQMECARHGLIPGKDPVEPQPLAGFEAFGRLDIETLADSKFERDTSKPNRTSIAFLFEYGVIRILFTGDADDPRLVESLQPLADKEGGRVRLDALKVSHHGSRRNLSASLLQLIDCPLFLISTNGDRHGHPDPVTMARILKFGGKQKVLAFNYESRAANWTDAQWMTTYHYSVSGPDPGGDGFKAISW